MKRELRRMPSPRIPAREEGSTTRDADARLLAGSFGQWLRAARAAQRSPTTTNVACGACNACCRSSYFIHIGPHERRTLARIPKSLLFKAPGMPRGHVLMGYDEHGRCPMLVDDRCSIYEDRPQTCRDYDCRLFTATHMLAGGDDKRDINHRIRRWQFSHDEPGDETAAEALAAAAAFLARHASAFPAGFLPTHPTQLALIALEVYDLFEARTDDETGESAVARTVAAVHARWTALREQRETTDRSEGRR